MTRARPATYGIPTESAENVTRQVLRISALQKYYGAKLILDDVYLLLNRGDRAALVGENGAGKSTLARLILGREEADAGEIARSPGTQTGYLPQELQVDSDISVADYIAQSVGELASLRRRLRELEARMAEDGDIAAALEEYGQLQETFEARGGYTLSSRREQIFAGLGLTHIDAQRPLMSLSGGEKTRVGLAALLLRSPDLLILDEPTNHLDFAGLAWLENYLLAYQQALLMITHDRRFINRVASKIFDLSPVTHSLTTYFGNYDEYRAQRDAKYQSEVEAYHAQVNRMKALRIQMKKETHGHRKAKRPDDGDKWIKFVGQQQSQRSASRLVGAAQQELRWLEAARLDNPRHVWHIQFDFDPLPLTSMAPVRLSSLSMSFGSRRLIREADAVILKGDRIALLAPNGAGKTTLLRIIQGDLRPTSGEVKIAAGVRPGYLDQTGESFDEGQNILDALSEISHDSPDNLLTLLHRSGLFRDAHLARKTVADLSLGQRRKLGLVCLIHSRANLLLLDEPTNHLDLMSMEALERSLRRFPGAILAATHDRWFVERVANKVWSLRDGVLVVEAPNQVIRDLPGS